VKYAFLSKYLYLKPFSTKNKLFRDISLIDYKPYFMSFINIVPIVIHSFPQKALFLGDKWGD